MNTQENIRFSNYERHGRQLYFFLDNFNALCKFDLDSREMDVLSSLPDEYLFTEKLACGICLYNNSIIVAPARTQRNALYKYDIELSEWELIELGETDCKPPYEKYAFSTIVGDNLILVGQYLAEIVVVNLNNKDINHYTLEEADGLKFHHGCKVLDGYLYVPCAQKNGLYRFGLSDSTIDFFAVGDDGNGYSGIEYWNGRFWLAPWKNNSFVEWDGGTVYKNHDLPKEYLKRTGYLFNGVMAVGNELLFNGLEGVPSFCCDNSGQIHKTDNQSYIMMQKLGDSEYSMMNYDGLIKMVENGNSMEIQLPNAKSVLDKLIDVINKGIVRADYDKLMNENKVLDLSSYIKLI